MAVLVRTWGWYGKVSGLPLIRSLQLWVQPFLLSGRIWSINGERVGVVQDGTVVKSLYYEFRLAGHGSLLHHPLTM